MGRLLPGVLELHDVPDVESFCRAVIAEYQRRHGARLRDVDYDDALAFLIAEAWEVSVRWETWPEEYESRGRTVRRLAFRSYASWKLGLRLVDYFRALHGRNGQQQSSAVVVPILGHDYGGGDPVAGSGEGAGAGGDRLGSDLGEGSVDRPVHRYPDRLRHGESGPGAALQDVALDDLPAPRRARSGDPRAAAA
jgi:hypothetical protein